MYQVWGPWFNMHMASSRGWFSGAVHGGRQNSSAAPPKTSRGQTVQHQRQMHHQHQQRRVSNCAAAACASRYTHVCSAVHNVQRAHSQPVAVGSVDLKLLVPGGTAWLLEGKNEAAIVFTGGQCVGTAGAAGCWCICLGAVHNPSTRSRLQAATPAVAWGCYQLRAIQLLFTARCHVVSPARVPSSYVIFPLAPHPS